MHADNKGKNNDVIGQKILLLKKFISIFVTYIAILIDIK